MHCYSFQLASFFSSVRQPLSGRNSPSSLPPTPAWTRAVALTSHSFTVTSRIAIHTPPSIFGPSGLLSLVSVQASFWWAAACWACGLTTQSRGPPHGHDIQIRSNRRPCVGPLFWLLEPNDSFVEIQIRCGWFGHAARSRFSCLNVSLRRDVSGTIKMASYQLGLTHTPAAVRNRSCNCISESHKGVCHTRIASSISSISRFFVRNFTHPNGPMLWIFYFSLSILLLVVLSLLPSSRENPRGL